MSGPIVWSMIDQYRTCPAQYAAQRVYKTIKYVPNAVGEYGKKAHTFLDKVCKNTHPDPANDEFAYLLPLYTALEKIPGAKLSEHRMAINTQLLPCSWNAADCAYRSILDLLIINFDEAIILDWKFGKLKDSDQLEFYALLVFAHFPLVHTITTRYVWVRDRAKTTQSYKRENIKTIWSKFLPYVERIKTSYEQDDWPERPSGLCKKYCGHTYCKFNGRNTNG